MAGRVMRLTVFPCTTWLGGNLPPSQFAFSALEEFAAFESPGVVSETKLVYSAFGLNIYYLQDSKNWEEFT